MERCDRIDKHKPFNILSIDGGGILAGIPHYNACNTLSRQSSRLLHKCCLWSSGIFFAFTISEKSTCLRIFKTILSLSGKLCKWICTY